MKMNNEVYRKDKTQYIWRCSEKERKQLKMLSAESGYNMSELLSFAWRNYYLLQQKKKRKKANSG